MLTLRMTVNDKKSGEAAELSQNYDTAIGAVDEESVSGKLPSMSPTFDKDEDDSTNTSGIFSLGKTLDVDDSCTQSEEELVKKTDAEDSSSEQEEDFVLRKPDAKKVLPIPFNDESLDDLDDDDSFLNPPTSSKHVGKTIVKNYEKRGARDDSPPTRLLRNANTSHTVTTYNHKIAFAAVRGSAKSNHDFETYGIRSCGLHPYCKEKFHGGEEIGLVFVISPEFHISCEDNTWVCWRHAMASLEGIESQISEKAVVTSTPKC